MRRSAFRQRGVLKKLFIFQFVMMNSIYFKHSLRQCSGLIKNNDPGFGKRFQIIGAFYKHSCVACPADPRKKAQWDTDNQSAGTTDDEKRQSPVDPCAPVRVKPHPQHSDKRRQNSKSKSRPADSGRIDAGKF